MKRAATLSGLVALLVALGVVTVLALRREPEQTRSAPRRVEKPFVPPGLDADFAALRVLPGERLALRDRPGGRVIRRVGARTEYGSPQTLALAAASGGRWLAVRSPALGNDEVGWIDARAARLRLLRRSVLLEVDLSRRELAVRTQDGRIARRFAVGVGAPDTPTPTGDFYVTDKLRGARFGPYYGCCILALSGRQPNLPRGWSGGDRLAIHGSPAPTWGKAASNGCLHADEPDLAYLMKTAPLGTRVLIQT